MPPTPTTVPFLDLRAPYDELRVEIDAACERVLKSGRYLLGPEVAAFEAEFAGYCGAAHCVTVGSCGDAITLTLRALDIGQGSEVIVPAHTFVATWFAVCATGAVPVPVEPDPRTHTLDPARVEAAVTPHTRAIVPVHLYGHPADLTAVEDIAARHGIPVVEDAAQAVGARHRGRRIGAGPNPVAFSFYPGKNLGAMGDGGAVVTSDAGLADRLRLLRNYGARSKYDHEVRGTNSRLDELQAAILRVKLARLDQWNARRAAVARRYRDGLADLADLGALVLPTVAPWAEHAWHLFVVRSAHRAPLRERLAAAGVQTLVHYPIPPHRSGAYADAGLGPFPRTERLCDEVLSLPVGPHLSEGEVSTVIDAVTAAVRGPGTAGDAAR